ncbi:keratinocyte-associated protein 3 [Brachionichthys hirsutus]|uniref:keratinocyte-associated protein 3 n=1 Tax=Brachionichthys hirsutus TaxID=412623 RepID=UPI0036043575
MLKINLLRPSASRKTQVLHSVEPPLSSQQACGKDDALRVRAAVWSGGSAETVCFPDKDKGPRRLMKKGLTLILVGHVNFILGAIVHGSVLRHISKPSQHVTTEYTAANIISVTSGLLSIATGIIAILVSRNLCAIKLQIGLLIASFLSALLSAACCVGLLVAISITVIHNGQGLMLGCNGTQVAINARSPVSARCPFDTTRIYDTTLALWIPCALFAAFEAGLSVWCFIVGLVLRGLAPCVNSYIREQLEEGAECSPHSERLMEQRLNPDA